MFQNVKILNDSDKKNESGKGSEYAPDTDEGSSCIESVDLGSNNSGSDSDLYSLVILMKRMKLIDVECGMKSICKIFHSHHQDFPLLVNRV